MYSNHLVNHLAVLIAETAINHSMITQTDKPIRWQTTNKYKVIYR